jgi:hypothetical protein
MNSHIAAQLASARVDELRSRAAAERQRRRVAPGHLARAWSWIRASRQPRRTEAAGEVVYLADSARTLADGSWLHARNG